MSYLCTKFELPGGGVPKLTRGSRSFFYPTTKSGVSIIEWSLLNANVLDLRYVVAL